MPAAGHQPGEEEGILAMMDSLMSEITADGPDPRSHGPGVGALRKLLLALLAGFLTEDHPEGGGLRAGRPSRTSEA